MGLLSAGSHKRDKREEGKLCAHLMLAYITYYHHQMHDIFCRHPSLTEIPFTSDPPRSFCINQSRIRLHAISQGDKTNFFIFNVSISSLHTPYIEVSFSYFYNALYDRPQIHPSQLILFDSQISISGSYIIFEFSHDLYHIFIPHF
jgi:hypothetical protein